MAVGLQIFWLTFLAMVILEIHLTHATYSPNKTSDWIECRSDDDCGDDSPKCNLTTHRCQVSQVLNLSFKQSNVSRLHLGELCQTDETCGTNAQCRKTTNAHGSFQQRCQCQEGYVTARDAINCVLGKIQLGKACTESQWCGKNAACRRLGKNTSDLRVCQCAQYYENRNGVDCAKDYRSCFNDWQCGPYAWCNGNTCQCRQEYLPASGELWGNCEREDSSVFVRSSVAGFGMAILAITAIQFFKCLRHQVAKRKTKLEGTTSVEATNESQT